MRWKRNGSPYAWTVMNLVDSRELCNYFIASFIPLIFCLFQLSTSYLLRHLDIRDLMAKCISKWLPQMYQWNTNSVWELFPCHLIVYIRWSHTLSLFGPYCIQYIKIMILYLFCGTFLLCYHIKSNIIQVKLTYIYIHIHIYRYIN